MPPRTSPVRLEEGRNPNPYFDARLSISRTTRTWLPPSVNTAPALPEIRRAEGRNPSACSITSAYLAANPDVAASGVNPLLHFLGWGQAERRRRPDQPRRLRNPYNVSFTEDTPGALVGRLSASGPAAGSVTFAVDDPRFEVVGDQFKLRAGILIDHEALLPLYQQDGRYRHGASHNISQTIQ